MPISKFQLERLKALRLLMKKHNVEALIINSSANRRYFSGFEAEDPMINESCGALLITSRKQYLLTDSRFTQAAKEEAPLFDIITYRQGLATELGTMKALNKTSVIHFEAEFLSVASLARLRQNFSNRKLDFQALPFNLDSLRAVKSPLEIKLIRKALSITEKALEALFTKMEDGLSEREAAFFLENEFRRLGAEGPSFETIVASGPNGAKPHAVPGKRKIKKGDLVIIDCGARYKAYCADISRTVIIGEARGWQKEIYTIVREAQLKAIKAIKAGVPASEIDHVARKHIHSCGYGPYFGHGLGHGVGLLIHEAPSLSPNNKNQLQAGEIITVEPGIYLPGKGGVRLEELVLVTEKGHEVLNRNKDFYTFN